MSTKDGDAIHNPPIGGRKIEVKEERKRAYQKRHDERNKKQYDELHINALIKHRRQQERMH